MKIRFHSGISLACLAITMTAMAHATDLVTQKLTGRWTTTPAQFALGLGEDQQTLACTPAWIVAGAPFATETAAAPHHGAVQVFNAVTGAWVRKIMPPSPHLEEANFGSSIAVLGNTAVIGQASSSNLLSGSAFVVDLTNGKFVMSLKAPDPDNVPDNHYGSAVGITPNRIVVGAKGLFALPGAAYVYDRKTGSFLGKLQPAEAMANDKFGATMAIEGEILIVGARGMDAGRGAAYAYDLNTLALIKKLQPTASMVGDSAGHAVGIHQGKVVLSAPQTSGGQGKLYIMDLVDGSEHELTSSDNSGGDRLGFCLAVDGGVILAGAPYHQVSGGAAYVFDFNSTTGHEIRKLLPVDSHQNVAVAVALCGSTAVLASGLDNTQALFAGAVYVMRHVTRPMPLVKVTAKGDYAPGAENSSFKTIGDAFINADGELAFTSTLDGPVSGDSGMFSSLQFSPWVDLVLKTRQVDSGATIGVVSKPLINSPARSFFQTTLTGKTVKATNNQAIYMDNGQNVMQVFRTGNPIGIGGTAVYKSFVQVVQNRSFDRIALTHTLQQGVNNATKDNDSGLVIFDPLIGDSQVRENQTAGSTSDKYGQFTGRVTAGFDRATYATAVTGAAANNQALFQKQFQSPEVLVARKGLSADGAGTAIFSSFIGECNDADDTVLYRAALGGKIPAATNEALWTRKTDGTTILVLRKGDSLPGQPNAVIAKFLNFWQVDGQTMALVQLTGKGVVASSDLALILYQRKPFEGQILVLMREGEQARGCAPATIGTIHRVEVDPVHGHYLVLATLAGAPAGTELALFRGFSSTGTTAVEQLLRRPFVVLRKGQLFSNQPSKLKSIILPTTNVTAAGAGGVGLGTAMQEPTDASTAAAIVIAVDFDNGVRQLVKGIP